MPPWLFTGQSSAFLEISIGLFLGLFIAAVIANVLYCFAYIPDFVVQVSDFRDLRGRVRMIFFLTGTGLAAAFTYLVSHGP